MKLRNLFLSLLAGSAMLFSSCEDCDHEGDKSMASSLQVGDVVSVSAILYSILKIKSLMIPF